MRLLLISGSVRRGSTNEAVLRTAMELAGEKVEPVLFSGLAALPHFNPDEDRDPLPPPVAQMREAIRQCDCVLICTPEYAGDMPGSFKNLLDWTVGGVETERKPVGWINASATPQGAAGAHQMLRTVLTYTGCDVVDQACVHIPVPRDAIDAGIVRDPAMRKEIQGVVKALSLYVEGLSVSDGSA